MYTRWSTFSHNPMRRTDDLEEREGASEFEWEMPFKLHKWYLFGWYLKMFVGSIFILNQQLPEGALRHCHLIWVQKYCSGEFQDTTNNKYIKLWNDDAKVRLFLLKVF